MFVRVKHSAKHKAKNHVKHLVKHHVKHLVKHHVLIFFQCTGNGPNGTDAQCRAVVEYSCVIAMSPQRCHLPLVFKPTSSKRSSRNFATHRSAPHVSIYGYCPQNNINLFMSYHAENYTFAGV